MTYLPTDTTQALCDPILKPEYLSRETRIPPPPTPVAKMQIPQEDFAIQDNVTPKKNIKYQNNSHMTINARLCMIYLRTQLRHFVTHPNREPEYLSIQTPKSPLEHCHKPPLPQKHIPYFPQEDRLAPFPKPGQESQKAKNINPIPNNQHILEPYQTKPNHYIIAVCTSCQHYHSKE